jgi:AmmeMemoRadiSam system protein B
MSPTPQIQIVNRIRRASVAGMFYPGDPRKLREAVQGYLAEADAEGPTPVAVIAPHAGYIYSGPIAASAYARLAPLKGRVSRVVLIGPAHRLPFRGLAVSGADAFETPLGTVPLDKTAIAAISGLPQVKRLDAAFDGEHCLEVHLPFLQTVLGAFKLVPIVVGDATSTDVAEVLEKLWTGADTLPVISSDLSHYNDYASARRRDRETSKAIEAMAGDRLDWDDACGRVPIAGLLQVAKKRGYAATTIDLRNSGDTAGPRNEVVGYGAWVVA